MKMCTEPGCGRKMQARGLCNTHYSSARIAGTIQMSNLLSRTPEERFWEMVSRDPSGCWLWTGAKIRGYGVLVIDGRNQFAHRFSYALHVGPIPTGLNVCHACDVPACVNPEHLWVGSQSDNMADKIAKVRGANQYGPWDPSRVCSEPGCGRKYKALGLCDSHYKAQRKAQNTSSIGSGPS